MRTEPTEETCRGEWPFAPTNNKPLSQSRLIWRRFRQHRAGYLAGWVLAIMALSVFFAGFLAPYPATSPHSDAQNLPYAYVPPMLGRIHFQGLRPFVYGLKRTYDPLTSVRGYGEDTSQVYYLKLFVHGEPYRFLGLLPTDLHLFGTGQPPDSPGQFFPLGTDRFGRDLFSRILIGGRISLGIGPLVVLLSFAVGILLGGLSGYYGGGTDTVIQRTVEVAMSLPRLALLLALSAALPPQLPAISRFWGIVAILTLVGWAPLARVVRGQFLALREESFVLAARALGLGDLRIIFKHILPNTASYLIVAATLAAPSVILLESVLSFFRFGVQEPLVSWGLLMADLQDNFQYQIQFHPWLLIPGLFIFITVLAFNYLGDALRDAVDPFNIAEGPGI
ncbi:MAG TPA: ABC transporter permease [Candidatus Fraserbacteria bacterium]|nr:ABC transporter permease [Candidatus Fraserbacteria bacterium]